MTDKGSGAEPAADPWLTALITLLGFEALAVAVWLLPASIHIVRWPESGPVRLALLAPAWQLLVEATGALAVAAFVLWRGMAARLLPFTRALVPLWLWAVPCSNVCDRVARE